MKPAVVPAAAAKNDATPKPAPDRAAMFEQKDTNHDGKLSSEEFLANQSDAGAARKRFAQWDTDKNESLSRKEFFGTGK